jgi:prepilin-type N-terminal cleavage/methylation domain-containing protein
MMFSGLRLINGCRRGFTLIELLVAMCLAGLLIGGITMTVFQVLVNPAQSSKHMTAVKQVENAIYWVRHDVVQTQIMEPGASSGFPLKLTWIDWNNVRNEVTYNLQNDVLQRGYVTYDADGSLTDNRTSIVAEYIDTNSAMTSCQAVGSILFFKITSNVTGMWPSCETRSVEIAARSAD